MSRKHKVPIMMDAKMPTPRHIIIKMPKVKDYKRLLKVGKEVSSLLFARWEGVWGNR